MIEVTGENSGGEVEFLLLRHDGRLWVGVGSDHTDREVEKFGVTFSKQICDKPLSPVFWAYDEVAPHWDRLILRSFVIEDGERRVYQEGSVASMLDPATLIENYSEDGDFSDSALMFGGTLAAHGGVRATDQFSFEIEDTILGRKISHAYRVSHLPVLG